MLASCQPDTGCRVETNVTAGVIAEWVKIDTLGKGTLQTQWDSLSLQGIGSDSILYNNAKAVKTLRLPLRADTGQTEYSIQWHGMTDVLHIKHNNDRHYINMACGCIVFHTIDTVWSNGVFIDSISILNSTVENYEQDNIFLRLKAQETQP